jgi:hypothetical protein
VKEIEVTEIEIGGVEMAVRGIACLARDLLR